MNSFEQTLQVNKFARRARHLKVFSGTMVAKNYAKDFLSFAFSPLIKLWNDSAVSINTRKFAGALTGGMSELLPVAPQKRLLSQTVILSISTLLVTSFTVSGNFTESAMSLSSDYLDAYATSGDILVSDEDGYLVKINPQTNESNRIGMTDYAIHTVAGGETLSIIAERYGLKVETIMWENQMANANTLRAGQSLLVPPVDGIGYNVKSGDNLAKISKQYNVSTEAIIAQNNLGSDIINQGQSLFLPGAKPLISPSTVATKNYRNTAVSRDARTYVNAAPSSDTPVGGRSFIFPTRGKITQGYRGGHYALDIADRSKPPIWASGGGTVSKVSTGTWGGGYGNHIIIDHGDGLQTLYAHMDSVGVSEGQWVNQGDVLGIMGNTGRVYGATGIHLHWEVHINGVKQNPGNYY